MRFGEPVVQTDCMLQRLKRLAGLVVPEIGEAQLVEYSRRPVVQLGERHVVCDGLTVVARSRR